MYRKLIQLSLFGALALALCLTGTTAALAQTVCVTEDLTGETFFNPCTGTDMTWTKGTAKACVQFVEDANGGVHAKITIVIHGQATDDSDGTLYVINAHGSQTQSLNSGGATVATASIHENFIGQGQAPNFNCRGVAHVTINADGTITAEFLRVSEDCDCVPF